MIRNLKALGLALAAAFAFGAISASGASATTEPNGHFWCDGYPCSFSGEQPAGDKHKIVTAAGSIECEVTKVHALLSGPTYGLTATPTFEECIFHNSLSGIDNPATVTMNGCDTKFTIHFHETSKGEGFKADTYSGDVHIECPVGKVIEIHVYNNAGHTEVKCTFHIAPQTVDNIDYFDHTSSAIDIRTTEAPTAVKRTQGSLLQCGAENQTAKYSGSVTAKSSNEGGGTTDGGINPTL